MIQNPSIYTRSISIDFNIAFKSRDVLIIVKARIFLISSAQLVVVRVKYGVKFGSQFSLTLFSVASLYEGWNAYLADQQEWKIRARSHSIFRQHWINLIFFKAPQIRLCSFARLRVPARPRLLAETFLRLRVEIQEWEWNTTTRFSR